MSYDLIIINKWRESLPLLRMFKKFKNIMRDLLH